MNLHRESILGVWLALIVGAGSIVACGSETPAPDEGTGATGGTASGGKSPTAGTGPKGGSAPTAGNGTSTGGSGVGGATSTGGTASGGTGPAGTGGTTSGTGGTGPIGTGGTGPSAGTGGNLGMAGSSTTGGSGGSDTAGSGGSDTAGSGPMGGAAGSMAGGPPVVDEPEVVTSAQGAYWKVGTLTEATGGSAEVTVNATQEKQKFTGFGGTFNEKGWEALAALNAADRERAIRLLFDAADGAKFVYGRIPIGASDYAVSRYTLNDNAGDTAMNMFSLARDKMRLIPYIKAAQAVNPNIIFWGSPWTPPPWMKDNNSYDRGNMKEDATTLTAYALYFAKWIEGYAEEGITIDAVHPQNEPGWAQDYPSCGWTNNGMSAFIGTYLGPLLQQRGLSTRIFLGTMSNSAADKDRGMLNAVGANATAKPFIKGYGLQWAMVEVYSQLQMDKSLEIWQTEHECGNNPWEGHSQTRAPNDHAYGKESWGLIKSWINAGVTSYQAWNMVLDTVGHSLDTVRTWAQNALLAVDTGQKQLILTPTYYVFRHLSQYVDPDAKVVGTQGGDALAFKNPDGTLVLVMYNSGGAKMSTVSMGGKLLQFQMPGDGWATVNYKPE